MLSIPKGALTAWREAINFVMERSGVSIPTIASAATPKIDRTYAYRCIKGGKNGRDPSLKTIYAINRGLGNALQLPEATSYLNCVLVEKIPQRMAEDDHLLFIEQVCDTLLPVGIQRGNRNSIGDGEIREIIDRVADGNNDINQYGTLAKAVALHVRREMLWRFDVSRSPIGKRNRAAMVFDVLDTMGVNIDDFKKRRQSAIDENFSYELFVETVRNALVDVTQKVPGRASALERIHAEGEIVSALQYVLEKQEIKISEATKRVELERDKANLAFSRLYNSINDALSKCHNNGSERDEDLLQRVYCVLTEASTDSKNHFDEVEWWLNKAYWSFGIFSLD